jgi:hypothetical protein
MLFTESELALSRTEGRVRNNSTLKIIIYSVIFLLIGFLQVNSQVLKSKDNKADYLIITTESFRGILHEFSEWRSSKGFEVFTTDVETIYTEFLDDDTTSHAEAIRRFVSFALTEWEKSPRYMLLAGSRSDIPGLEVKSFLTTLDEEKVFLDHYLGENIYDSDNLVDIAIGRFPAETPRQLLNMIEKTISVSDNFNIENYKYDFVGISDVKDSSIFNKQLEHFNNIFNNENTFIRHFTDSESDNEMIFAECIEALQAGTSILHYSGHANSATWSHVGILTRDEVPGLELGTTPFLHIAQSCQNSIRDNGINEEFMKYESGGAFGVILFDGMFFSFTGHQYFQKFYQSVLEYELPLGDHVTNTKTSLDSDIMRRVTLFGDPAMRLPQWIIASVAENLSLSENSMKTYPNPAGEELNIEFHSPERMDFTVKIISATGETMIELPQAYGYTGDISVKADVSDLPAGSYFAVIAAGSDMRVGKFIKK